MVNIVAKVCGTDRLCNATGQKQNTDGVCSVCEFCSCDDKCFAHGDCCVDKLLDECMIGTPVVDTPILNSNSKYTKCFDQRVRDRTWRSPESKNILLFTSCPEDYHDDEVIRKCAFGKTASYGDADKIKVEDLLNIWPLHSKITSLSYRNYACAQCHNDVQDLEYWNIKVNCPNSGNSPQGLTQIEGLQWALDKADCYMLFQGAPNIQERTCIHDIITNDPINRCEHENATSSEVALTKACQNIPLLVKSNKIFFNNVFCELCRYGKLSKPVDNCPTQTPFYFFFVISPSAIQKVVSSSKSPIVTPISDQLVVWECRCNHYHEAWDPIEKTCRIVQCPQGFKLSRDEDSPESRDVNYRCVSDETESFGLIYQLNIQLTLSTNKLTVKQDLQGEMFKKIAKHLTAQFKEKIKPITLFGVNIPTFIIFAAPTECLSSRDANMTLGVSSTLMFKKTEHASHISEKLHALVKESWDVSSIFSYIPYSPKNVSFKAEVSSGPVSDITQFFDVQPKKGDVSLLRVSNCSEKLVAMNMYDDHCNCHSGELIDVKNTITCPYFIVDEKFRKYFEISKDENNNDVFLKGKLKLNYLPTNLTFYIDDFHRFFSGGNGNDNSNTTENLMVCADEILKSWKEIVENEIVEYQLKLKNSTHGTHAITFGQGLEITSVVCLSISCFCLFITLLTYITFPSLRTLPGMNTMALVITMLVTMVMCLVTPLFKTHTVTCQIVGVVTHFFLLSSITWMVICTYRTYRIFSRIFDHPNSHCKNWTRCFLKYLSVSITIPMIIITTAIVLNYTLHSDNNHDKNIENKIVSLASSNTSSKQEASNEFKHPIKSCRTQQQSPKQEASLVPIGYGDGVCYISNRLTVLLAAALPIILGILTNVVFFCLTIFSLQKMSMDQQTLKKEPRQQMLIYVKLSALTGLNWLPGILSTFVDFEILWYAFLLLAGLQGLYVLGAFVLNSRVLNMFKAKLYGSEGSSSRPNQNDAEGGKPGTKYKLNSGPSNDASNTKSSDVTKKTDVNETSETSKTT